MAFENGVNWQPLDPDRRGRHGDFNSALEAAAKGMLVQRNPFFDSLADRWPSLFPDLAARPGRYEDGKIFLYVKSAPANYAMRAKLPQIRRVLAALEGAPAKIDLRLEIRK